MEEETSEKIKILSHDDTEWINQVDPEFAKMVLKIREGKVNAKIISM